MARAFEMLQAHVPEACMGGAIRFSAARVAAMREVTLFDLIFAKQDVLGIVRCTRV